MTNRELVQAAKDRLLQATITGKQYADRLAKGQPAPAWDQAFAFLNQIQDVPAPAPDPVPDPVPVPAKYVWGFSAHALTPKLGVTATTYVPRLKAAGSSMMRDDIYPGTPQAAYDKLFKLAADNNQKLVLIMWGGGTPPALSTMQTWARTLAAYGKTNYPGVLHAIEPANEPNTNALSSPAAYVAHNNAVYAGVKEGDPAVKVWGGATNGDATAWARDVITGGARFDEWSCHPYPAWGFFPDAAGMLRTDIVSAWAQTWWRPEATTGKTLLQMLTSLGYNGLIHGTEGFNAPTNSPGAAPVPRCCSEQVAADVFAQSIAMWKIQTRAGVPFAYTGQDDNTFGTSVEDRFGAHHSDGTVKLIVARMQAA